MGPNNTSCGCKNGHSSQVLPRADIKQRHLQQYLNRTRFSHTPGFPCAGRTVGSAGSGILTLVRHVFGNRGGNRATDQECATCIYPPTLLEIIQTGIFHLGLDTERGSCHRGITVKDVWVSKLFYNSRVHRAHRLKVSEVRLEGCNAHASGAQFFGQGSSYVALRVIVQREVHAACGKEACRRLSNASPALQRERVTGIRYQCIMEYRNLRRPGDESELTLKGYWCVCAG